MKPHKVSRVIIACAVLHNLRLLWKEPEVVEDQVMPDQQPPVERCNGQMDGRGVRDHITRTYFNN